MIVPPKVRTVLACVALGLAALGCGSSGSSDKHPAGLEAPRVKVPAAFLNLISSSSDTRLNGVWKSKCIINEDSGSTLFEIEITDHYYQQTYSLFQDTSCLYPAMDARYIASYKAHQGQLDTTLKQVHAKVYQSLFTEAAQTAASCGFNRWQTHVWYDVTNKVCDRKGEGIHVTPTKAETKYVTPFSIEVTGRAVQLTLGDAVFTRPSRADEVPTSNPTPEPVVTPISGFLFADPNAQSIELFLKKWGCVESLEMGLSQCPAAKTMDEAVQLIDKLIAFGLATYGDANFKNNEAAQAKLRNGSSIELEKAKKYPAYAQVLKALEDGLARLHEEHPQFTFHVFTNENAVRATESLKSLRLAFENLKLEAELLRLHVARIYVSSSRNYATSGRGIYVMWNDKSTGEDMLAFLKSQNPQVVTPASILSPRGTESYGLGFHVQVR